MLVVPCQQVNIQVPFNIVISVFHHNPKHAEAHKHQPKHPETIFFVSLRSSTFQARNEVYGKNIESLFTAGNEFAPSSFPVWLKIRPLNISKGVVPLLNFPLALFVMKLSVNIRDLISTPLSLMRLTNSSGPSSLTRPRALRLNLSINLQVRRAHQITNRS